MDPHAWLARLNWPGSVQIHHAPLALVVDDRAHQVYVGFGEEEWATLRRDLLRRAPAQAEVTYPDGRAEALIDAPSAPLLALHAWSTAHAGGVNGLIQIVDRLVGPGGCPWDIEQTHASLIKYLLEESYEFADAVERGDTEAMREELGDILLQPFMHTQKKRLEGEWDADDVARVITEKLIRRHPHVFGDTQVADAEEVLRNWDRIKQTEKGTAPESVLAGIPLAMPALLLALQVSKRAARAGFEWPDLPAVWDKFEEEVREVKEALAAGEATAIRDEFGDLLFTVVNLARWCRVDPEEALRVMVGRFRRRFMAMEAAAGRSLAELSPEEWDTLWEQAKQSG